MKNIIFYQEQTKGLIRHNDEVLKYNLGNPIEYSQYYDFLYSYGLTSIPQNIPFKVNLTEEKIEEIKKEIDDLEYGPLKLIITVTPKCIKITKHGYLPALYYSICRPNDLFIECFKALENVFSFEENSIYITPKLLQDFGQDICNSDKFNAKNMADFSCYYIPEYEVVDAYINKNSVVFQQIYESVKEELTELFEYGIIFEEEKWRKIEIDLEPFLIGLPEEPNTREYKFFQKVPQELCDEFANKHKRRKYLNKKYSFDELCVLWAKFACIKQHNSEEIESSGVTIYDLETSLNKFKTKVMKQQEQTEKTLKEIENNQSCITSRTKAMQEKLSEHIIEYQAKNYPNHEGKKVQPEPSWEHNKEPQPATIADLLHQL